MGEGTHSHQRHEAMADKIAQVCRDLDAIRAVLHDAGEVACLDRLVEVVRSGGDASGPLQRIDELLGEDDDALDVFTGTRRSDIRPTGVAGSREVDVVFLCPGSRCARVWWPHVQATEPPRCQIFAEHLRWRRL